MSQATDETSELVTRAGKQGDSDAYDVASILYDVENNDPDAVLVDRSNLSSEEIKQITEVMAALGRLRDAEQRLAEASQRYMKLGRSDMRALHFLIVANNSKSLITPSAIASHLGISTASTTKLLDRLEAGGHITRSPHPHDRRALVITVSEETKEAAMETVGRLRSRLFYSAARLSAVERETVIRFLDDMTSEITFRGEFD